MEQQTNKRLMSLDALRGFDMFWIMGGCGLLCSIMSYCGCPHFGEKFGHVSWTGLQFMDTVFPTFLFMAGASFPFSMAKSLERGHSRKAIALRALRRGLTLILLGWVYQGLLAKFNFATFRIPSVLGYIGFGWMCAAWIYLFVRNSWARLGIGLGILAAVTLVAGLCIAPDAANFVWPSEGLKKVFAVYGTGHFSPVGNIGCWLDRTVLGRHALTPGFFDNEGFCGLPSTIVTALLGMFAGDIVRHGGLVASGRKVLALLGAAAISLGAGLLLSLYFPIVKNLWSPSFVLTVGAYSFAMFALFYWIIDVLGFVRWSFFFRVIGMNSITIYLAQRIIGFNSVQHFFLGGFAGLFPDPVTDIIARIGYVIACWLFLLFLYKKNVFLKV